ncbi:MAG: hypothetical protein L0196_00860 [candidate division Zixibacteria bacterium]|nr:hypothetical protein [candidate division Zixibacteria bacterium]
MKMRRVNFILLALCLGTLTLAGCSKRKNPAKPGLPPQGQVEEQPSVPFEGTLDLAHNALILNGLRPDPDQRRIRLYLPPGYQRRGSGRPFPTLYLLHDFGLYPDLKGQPAWNQGYFNLYELASIMDRLIASGEIQPMIVVQVDLANYFYGGSFYTNSTSAARYFTAVDSFLVHYVDSFYNTVFGRRSRAVSGHGMGGYGALKMVLMGNDTTFGSVSVLGAPLAFGDSGTTGKGFQSPAYINALFTENGITPGDSIRFRSDTVLFPSPLHTTKLKTNLLFAMGASFSPADTTFRDSIDTQPPKNGPGREALLARYPTYFQFSKSTHDPGFFFPFDWNGVVIESVWNRWIDHDIKRMLANPARAGRLDSTPLYLSCGLQDELGMLEQNRDFYQRLLAVRGASKQAANFIGMGRDQFYYEEYSGYPGRPAGHSTFIADQLVKVLKFHTQFLDTASVP